MMMNNTLGLIKDKTQALMQSQIGAVSFEFVLVIGGVSAVVVCF